MIPVKQTVKILFISCRRARLFAGILQPHSRFSCTNASLLSTQSLLFAVRFLLLLFFRHGFFCLTVSFFLTVRYLSAVQFLRFLSSAQLVLLYSSESLLPLKNASQSLLPPLSFEGRAKETVRHFSFAFIFAAAFGCRWIKRRATFHHSTHSFLPFSTLHSLALTFSMHSTLLMFLFGLLTPSSRLYFLVATTFMGDWLVAFPSLSCSTLHNTPHCGFLFTVWSWWNQRLVTNPILAEATWPRKSWILFFSLFSVFHDR